MSELNVRILHFVATVHGLKTKNRAPDDQALAKFAASLFQSKRVLEAGETEFLFVRLVSEDVFVVPLLTDLSYTLKTDPRVASWTRVDGVDLEVLRKPTLLNYKFSDIHLKPATLAYLKANGHC